MIPRSVTPSQTRAISRRGMLRALSLGGASAALIGALGSRAGLAADLGGPSPEWFSRNAADCRKDATCGGHGQLLIGEGPLYLSHLPMFMFDTPANHPHNYQVIVEVSLADEDLEAYLADREESGAPLYTLRPEATFRMLDLILAAQSTEPVQTLTGTIIRGHWEREGQRQPFDITFTEVRNNIPVTVERVVYAHEFSFHPQPLDRLEYVLFGAGDSLFLGHRITQAPDFDQFLPVTLVEGAFWNQQLREGIILSIPERANALAERLMDGDEVTAEARHALTGAAITARDPASGQAIADGIQLVAGRELFFEEGELRFPLTQDDFAPTEAEIAAGFGG